MTDTKRSSQLVSTALQAREIQLLLLTLVVVLIISNLTPNFLTESNLKSVAMGMTYDLIVALSPMSEKVVKQHLTHAATEVEYWEIDDPTGAEGREAALEKYRKVRDDLNQRIITRFPQDI